MTTDAAPGAGERLEVLDGWRAFSILLVLGAHMLPLGPHRWELNESAGYAGMAIFFTLSGFLITVQLHRGGSVAGFFIRRLFRTLPLAWFVILAVAVYLRPDPRAGLVAWAAGARMFVVLPATWLVMVAVRTWFQPGGTIETHLRVDEILSGTLLTPRSDRVAWLGSKPLKYVAEISYALYVLHPFSLVGWLGTGSSSWIKYAKRPICFALTFLAAHVSTFHFEHRYQKLAKAWCRRIEEKRRAAPGRRT